MTALNADGVNVAASAYGGVATAYSCYSANCATYGPQIANNGITTDFYDAGTVNNANFWTVVFNASYFITSVTFYNRLDNSLYARSAGNILTAYSASNASVFSAVLTSALTQPLLLSNCPSATSAASPSASATVSSSISRVSSSPSPTLSQSRSWSRSLSPSVSPTASYSLSTTLSRSASRSPSILPTLSVTASVSGSLTRTASATASLTRSTSISGSTTASPSRSATPSASPAPSGQNVAGLVSSLAAYYTTPAAVSRPDIVSAGTLIANPYFLTYAPALDMLFVPNVNTHTVSAIDPWSGSATLVAGSGSPGRADGTGTGAVFNTPIGTAYDGGSVLFLSEQSNNLIRSIAVAGPNYGVTTTLAGGGAANGYSAGCLNGVGSAATFYMPRGLAYRAGVVYVADYYNNAVRTVTVATATVATLAGACGVLNGFANGIGTNALFASPQAVAVDELGTLYLTDSWNELIRNISIGTGAVGVLAGGGLNRMPTSGSWAWQTNAGVYFHTDGVGLAASFWNPMGIIYDSRGNLVIADASNQLIRSISIATGIVTTIAGGFADSGGYSLPTAQQQPGYGLVDGLGTAAAFWNPFGITTDGAGNMWVADNYRSVIRFIGDLASPSVSPSVAPSPSPSAAAPATLVASVASTVRTLVAYPQGGLPRVQPSSLISLPQGAVLAAGTLYVTASGFHTLLAINPWSGATTLFAGSPTGAAGYTDSFSTAALFREPSGLAYDGMGTLFVADQYYDVVRSVTLASARVRTLAGYTPAGSTPLYGYVDGVGTNAAFNTPVGLSYAAGVVYVGDAYNCLIRAIDVATGIVTTLAGGGGAAGTGYTVSNSACGYANGVGSNAMFDLPSGVAADGLGRLYVADRWNNVVRSIVIATRNVSLLVGGGGGPYSAFPYGPGAPGTIAWTAGAHPDGAGTSAGFWQPYALALDGRGNLVVAEYQNCLLRNIALASVNVTTLAGGKAVAGGTSLPTSAQQPGYGWADGSGTAASFNNPTAVATDGGGNLWIADRQFSAIRFIGVAASPSVSPSVVPSPSPSAAAPPRGQANGVATVTTLTGVNNPMGIVYIAGSLYVSTAAYVVVRVTLAGAVYPFVGASGVSSYRDGVGSEAYFTTMPGLAFDGVDTVSLAPSPTLDAQHLAKYSALSRPPTSSLPRALPTILPRRCS